MIDDVVQPGLDPRRARAVQHQAVGRGQQHLEEDEQVEQIAGQEGAVQAHQQELEQRMEMRARAMPAREREHERGERQDAGQQQHQRRQPVEHQHDAERRRPVAEPIDARLSRRP